ncbi:MAG: hypothetical protein Ta2F_08010 [Termitinemataceae bacterium]|nr:MAG: hypothetical protein Ta2F_08010 [Termitinemataceae bacterium]
MIIFLIKKTFFDFLNNAFCLVLINAGFFILCAVPLLVCKIFDTFLSEVLKAVIIITGIIFCAIYMHLAVKILRNISDGKILQFKKKNINKNIITKNIILKIIFQTIPQGIVHGIFISVVFFIFNSVLPFFLYNNSMISLIMASLLFWAALIVIMAFQFFPSVRLRTMSSTTLKAVQESFSFFFGNKIFCILCMIFSAVIMLISLPAAFLFPGMAGVLLFFDEALCLRQQLFSIPSQKKL